MKEIEFIQFNEHNFFEHSLDQFIRTQSVTRCYRNTETGYALQSVRYTEGWNICEKRNLAHTIRSGIKNGNIAIGALHNREIVGFIYLINRRFGSENQYIDLAEFYVSKPYRRLGIGESLFKLACTQAKNCNATKLYISAHSAQESIAAYVKYGCTFACEIQKEFAEREPFDLQLEYDLL